MKTIVFVSSFLLGNRRKSHRKEWHFIRKNNLFYKTKSFHGK